MGSSCIKCEHHPHSVMINLHIVDVEVANADFWRRADAVSCFCGQSNDPRSRVFNVDLCVARVNSRKSDAIPSSKLNEVFDCEHGNLGREVST